ncbi:MAG: ferritin-like domain-containing protein [Clostridia bacterium]|nr:ferritin-like domain-containing protein [Clostridia bacterium]
MIVRNEQQALCVAVEMERRAIRVYERALMLATDPQVRAGIQEILSDEKEHFRRFSQMKEQCPMAQQDERMLTQAMAAEMLFPGGVMELERAKGLDTLKGLYAFAADSEQDAVDNYLSFAKKCSDAAIAEAFTSIAREESIHLAELKKKLESL